MNLKTNDAYEGIRGTYEHYIAYRTISRENIAYYQIHFFQIDAYIGEFVTPLSSCIDYRVHHTLTNSKN